MSDQEFERYLRLLGGLLRLNAGQRESISQELRDHLEERLEELLQGGVAREKAIELALSEFGDAAGLASQFVEIARSRRARRWRRMSIASAMPLAASLLLAWAMWPQQARIPLAQPVVAQSSTTTAAEPRLDLPDNSAAAEAADEVPQVAISESEKRIVAELDRAVDASFVELPLEDVIAFLRDATGADIELDARGLEQTGLSKDVPVTLTCTDQKLRSILTRICDQTSARWQVVDESILVTSPDTADLATIVRVHSIADLLPADPATGELDTEALMGILSSAASKQNGDWLSEGGIGNAEVSMDGVLVVSHNFRVQEEVAGLLGAMRQLKRKNHERLTDAVDPVAVDPITAKIRAALDRPLEAYNFQDTPLSEVVDYLATVSSLPIAIDVRQLEANGKSVDTPISSRGNNVSLATALKRLLRPLDLSWTISAQTLVIAPADGLSNRLSVRFYPVNDIISHPDVANSELERYAELVRSNLTNLVIDWAENGGAASVVVVPELNALCVNQTWEAHRKVEDLLRQLRKSKQHSSTARLARGLTGHGGMGQGLQPELRAYLVTMPDAGWNTQNVAKVLGQLLDQDNLPLLEPVGDRILVQAVPAVHNRIQRLCMKQLSGLLYPVDSQTGANRPMVIGHAGGMGGGMNGMGGGMGGAGGPAGAGMGGGGLGGGRGGGGFF